MLCVQDREETVALGGRRGCGQCVARFLGLDDCGGGRQDFLPGGIAGGWLTDWDRRGRRRIRRCVWGLWHGPVRRCQRAGPAGTGPPGRCGRLSCELGFHGRDGLGLGRFGDPVRVEAGSGVCSCRPAADNGGLVGVGGKAFRAVGCRLPGQNPRPWFDRDPVHQVEREPVRDPGRGVTDLGCLPVRRSVGQVIDGPDDVAGRVPVSEEPAGKPESAPGTEASEYPACPFGWFRGRCAAARALARPWVSFFRK